MTFILAGATESQVLCKNWYLPAAPEDGLTAFRSPPDSRSAIAFKWSLTSTSEPSDAEEVCVVLVSWVCWASCLGASTWGASTLFDSCSVAAGAWVSSAGAWVCSAAGCSATGSCVASGAWVSVSAALVAW